MSAYASIVKHLRASGGPEVVRRYGGRERQDEGALRVRRRLFRFRTESRFEPLGSGGIRSHGVQNQQVTRDQRLAGAVLFLKPIGGAPSGHPVTIEAKGA